MVSLVPAASYRSAEVTLAREAGTRSNLLLALSCGHLQGLVHWWLILLQRWILIANIVTIGGHCLPLDLLLARTIAI